MWRAVVPVLGYPRKPDLTPLGTRPRAELEPLEETRRAGAPRLTSATK